MTDERWIEPGRQVAPDGRIVYAWPPEGRFRALWERCALTFTDEEKHELLSLLNHWRYDTSTLVAYTNESGEWVDVEPDWDLPMIWMEGGMSRSYEVYADAEVGGIREAEDEPDGMVFYATLREAQEVLRARLRQARRVKREQEAWA